VIVLGIGKGKRIGANTLAQIAEAESNYLATSHILTAFPQVNGTNSDAPLNHLVGETVLAVKFERSSLDHHGARILARRLVCSDKPERNTAPRKTESQVKASRTGSDDQHERVFHGSALTEIIALRNVGAGCRSHRGRELRRADSGFAVYYLTVPLSLPCLA
jgi:hypothetical protein